MKEKLGKNQAEARTGTESSVKEHSPISRRTVVAGAAWATPVIMLASAAPAFAASSHGMACEINNQTYMTKAGGQFLSGNLLGLNLATVAEVKGIDVFNTPSGRLPNVTYEPADATVVEVSAGRLDGVIDAYKDPLSLSFLNALNINLNGLTESLGSLLNLAETGAVNQYGRAVENGYSRGFSGLVSNSGGVTLADSAGAPDLATIDLKKIVTRLGGTGLAAIVEPLAALNLKLGAVAGDATLDACNNTALREYYIAKLGLNVGSDLVAGVIDAVANEENGLLTDLEGTVDGLAGTGGLLDELVTEVTNIVKTAVALLLDTRDADVEVSASIDLKAVRQLLQGTLTGDALIIDLDNPESLIYLDLDSILGGAKGLNGLGPNTELLLNSTAINNQVSNVTSELNTWVQSITSSLAAAYDLIKIKVSVEIPLWTKDLVLVPRVHVATVSVDLETTLGDLLSGKAKISSTIEILSGSALTLPINNLLNGLLDAIDPLLSVLLTPLGLAIEALILPLVTNIGTVLLAVVAPLTTLLEDVLGILFGQNGLISLMVNVQEGNYDVAALRLGVLPTVAGGINIVLAHAYAGENTVMPA